MFSFVLKCFKEGWEAAEWYFRLAETVCAIVTVSLFAFKSAKPDKWKKWKEIVMRGALGLFLACFVFTTFILAPYNQVHEKEIEIGKKDDLKKELGQRLEKLTEEKNELQRKQDKAETILAAASLIVGNTNSGFTATVSNFVTEFGAMKNELSNTAQTNNMLHANLISLDRKFESAPVTSALAYLEAIFYYPRSTDIGAQIWGKPMNLYVTLPEFRSGEMQMETFKFSCAHWKSYDGTDSEYDITADFQSEASGTELGRPTSKLLAHPVSDLDEISLVELEMPHVSTDVFVHGSVTVFFNSMPRRFEIHSKFDEKGRIVLWPTNALTQAMKR